MKEIGCRRRGGGRTNPGPRKVELLRVIDEDIYAEMRARKTKLVGGWCESGLC
jgi:hypothetical protein